MVVSPLFFLWFSWFLGLAGPIGRSGLFRAFHQLGRSFVLLDVGNVGEVDGLQALGEFGVLVGEVLGLAYVGHRVVELEGFGREVLRFPIASSAQAILPRIELPFSTAHGAGSVHQNIVLMGALGSGLARHQRPNILPVDSPVGQLAAAQLGEGGQ